MHSTLFAATPDATISSPRPREAEPFQPMARARDAARSSATKVIYVRGGNYALDVPIDLGASDEGEAWVGYPGETVVLDGGGHDVFVMNRTS